MKTAQIIPVDSPGGATGAALRLHEGLRQLGHESSVFVYCRTGTDPGVIKFPVSKPTLWADVRGSRLGVRFSLPSLFYASTWALLARAEVCDCEVINLHNLHGGYFSLPVLPLLSRTAPVVWTLHDMWAFTGNCIYSYGCGRWRVGCGSCPRLEDYPVLRKDRTRWLFRLKREMYRWSRLAIVTPSQWLAHLASESPLLGNFPVRCIPNSLDVERFSPVDRARARRELALPVDGKMVLFVAHDLDDPRKGLAFLLQAMQQVARTASEETLLVLVGGRSGDDPHIAHGLKAIQAGFVPDEQVMAMYYSAADLVAFPTMADNLPCVVMESLACGTPVVGFDVGGVAEMVRHMETGYLARPADAADLAVGISTLLADDDLRRRLGENGRRLALREFSLEVQAKRYANLYEELLRERLRRGRRRRAEPGRRGSQPEKHGDVFRES